MKRLLALLVGGLGIRALLRRRGHTPAVEPPVDELREKLAQAKAAPEPAPEVDDVDARRADVHERARQALDELGESQS